MRKAEQEYNILDSFVALLLLSWMEWNKRFFPVVEKPISAGEPFLDIIFGCISGLVATRLDLL